VQERRQQLEKQRKDRQITVSDQVSRPLLNMKTSQ